MKHIYDWNKLWLRLNSRLKSGITSHKRNFSTLGSLVSREVYLSVVVNEETQRKVLCRFKSHHKSPRLFIIHKVQWNINEVEITYSHIWLCGQLIKGFDQLRKGLWQAQVNKGSSDPLLELKLSLPSFHVFDMFWVWNSCSDEHAWLLISGYWLLIAIDVTTQSGEILIFLINL